MTSLFYCIALIFGLLSPQDDLDRARTLLKEGNIEEAKAVCEQVVQQNPRESEGKRMLKDIILWMNAKKAGTSKAVHNYLVQTKMHLFDSEAVVLQSDLAVREDWLGVVKADKVNRYESFLVDHPGSVYEDQAKNGLARALADSFSRHTSLDTKNRALSFANDEATREYVDYAFGRATGTLDSEKVYLTDPQLVYDQRKEQKKITIAVGVMATGYLGVGYENNQKKTCYLAGGGVTIRINDFSQPFNYVFSLQLLDFGVYAPTKSNKPGSVPFRSDWLCPVGGFDINWNFIRTDRMSVLMNLGIIQGRTTGFRASVGTACKHVEWKTGFYLFPSEFYAVYVRPEEESFLTPIFGTSLSFYF